MAKSNLTQGILNGVLIASDPAGSSAQAAAYIAQLVNMKYGRDDELESDKIGVNFLANSGYNPTALVGVMKILEESSGGASQAEFFSTHPNPSNRISQINSEINKLFPEGVPSNLVE